MCLLCNKDLKVLHTACHHKWDVTKKKIDNGKILYVEMAQVMTEKEIFGVVALKTA